MRKLIIAAAALSAIAPSVYASKARILALGDATEDNYFVEDSRRIFTNAAHAHTYKNQVFLEWGENGSATSGTLDTDQAPKAMGGFLMESGNLVYGAYLGNESNISSSLRIIASDTAGNGGGVLPTADNQLDLFVAGKAGSLKWGADFIYTKADNTDSNKLKAEDSAMAIKTGVVSDRWEAFLNLSLKSESEVAAGYNSSYTNKQKFEGKLGLQVGGIFKLGNGAEAFATVKKFDWDQTVTTTKSEGGLMTYRLGYGKKIKTGNGHAFARAFYESINLELERSGTATAELKNTRLPIVLGYEAQANSWLTLRGSVTHNLMGSAEGKNLSTYLDNTATGALQKAAASNYHGHDGTNYLDGKKTITNSTVVNAGASLNFGKLTVDGFVGTTAGARTGNNNTKNGVLATDNLLTRVGMTYAF